jgi:hypothetical protein
MKISQPHPLSFRHAAEMWVSLPLEVSRSSGKEVNEIDQSTDSTVKLIGRCASALLVEFGDGFKSLRPLDRSPQGNTFQKLAGKGNSAGDTGNNPIYSLKASLQ